jgi:hypothetical protein
VAGAAMREHLVGLLLSRLDPQDRRVPDAGCRAQRISIPRCGQAVTGAPDAAERLPAD